jgi:hypothetical protein
VHLLLALLPLTLAGDTPCECSDVECSPASCSSNFIDDTTCENEGLCLAGEMACKSGVCCGVGLTLEAGDQCCSWTNCESSDPDDYFVGKADSHVDRCFSVDIDGYPVPFEGEVLPQDQFGFFSIVTSHRGEGVFPYETAFGTDTNLTAIIAEMGVVNETEGDVEVLFETAHKRKIRVQPSYTIRRALPKKFKWEMEYLASDRPSGGLYGFGTPYAPNRFVKATAVFTNNGKHDVVLDRVRYETFVDTVWNASDPLQLDNYFASEDNDLIIHGARCAPQTSVAEGADTLESDGLGTKNGTYCLPGVAADDQALVAWDNVVVPKHSTVRMSVIYVKILSTDPCEMTSYLEWLDMNLGNDDMWWKDLQPLEKKQEYNFACSIDRVESARDDVSAPCMMAP